MDNKKHNKYRTDSQNIKRFDKLTIKYAEFAKEIRNKAATLKTKEVRDKFLAEEAKKLMKKEKLPDNWFTFLQRFLSDNKSLPPITDAHLRYDPQKGELYIRIYKTTKKENIIKLWESVKEIQNKLPNVAKPSKIDKKYLEIIERRKTESLTSREVLDDEKFQAKVKPRKNEELEDTGSVNLGIHRVRKILEK